jgi:cold shock CspA family protein
MTGLVTHFNPARGFGFIRPLVGDGPDTPAVYFHVTGVCSEDGTRPALPKGAEVEFDLCRGKKGPQCANIRLRKINGRELRRKEN